MNRAISLLLFFCSFITNITAQQSIIVQERLGVQRTGEPITLGIPFEKGDIQNLNNISILENGTPIEAQFITMSRWNDQSIKWVKTDFQANILANSVNDDYKISTSTNPMAIQGIVVNETTSTITVNTGVLEFSIDKINFNLFNTVHLDVNGNSIYENAERIIDAGNSAGASVVNNGQSYSSPTSSTGEVLIEEQGPMKVVIKASGVHSNTTGNYLKYTTRIYAYKDKPYVHVNHTYANPTTVASLGNLDDPSLGANIDSYSLNLNSNLSAPLTFTFGDSDSSVGTTSVNSNENVSIEQNDRVLTTAPFRYDLNKNETQVGTGQRAEGWVIINDNNVGIGISTQYFWEKYPKGFSVSGTGDININPVLGDPEFLHVGMGTGDKHLIWFMPTSEITMNQPLLRAMTRDPLIARCDQKRFENTDVFHTISTCYEDVGDNLSTYINETSANHLLNREDLDMYGNLTFGDVPRGRFELDPERMFSTWGNNYYDCNLTAARLFAITGEAQYFDILKPMATHWMETDCWNTSESDWLNGYCPSYSSNHRDNPNFNHHYGEGIWYYYYLTGDERAKEIGLRAARSIDQQQFWANENVFLRGASLRGAVSLEAYKATGEIQFLIRARQQIDAIMNTQNAFGQIGNSFENGTDIQDGQTFMMGLFSDLVWKYLQEDYNEGLKNQLVLLADFVHTYARIPNQQEEYYNFWHSPELPGPPQFFLEGSLDDYVYWNSKGLIAGLYAYAYYFTDDNKYKTYSENLLEHIYGEGYQDSFGSDFWGKASAQAMKNALHAASIVCNANNVTTPTSHLGLMTDCIEIYPNPTGNFFTITGDLGLYNLDILDVMGNTVQTINSSANSESIDITQLGSGMYFIRAIHKQNNLVHIEIVVKE